MGAAPTITPVPFLPVTLLEQGYIHESSLQNIAPDSSARQTFLPSLGSRIQLLIMHQEIVQKSLSFSKFVQALEMVCEGTTTTLRDSRVDLMHRIDAVEKGLAKFMYRLIVSVPISYSKRILTFWTRAKLLQSLAMC